VRNYLSIDGFHVFSGGNEFRGLAFTHLRRSIWLSGHNAHDNIVAGCFIGTDPAGQPWYEAINNVEGRGSDDGAFGMWIDNGAHHNRIGGTGPADRNVISGNANDGGGGSDTGTEYNRFIGNLIGLSPDGTRRLRNMSDGLDLNFGMSHTQVGGTAPGERNVIAGNSGEGVEISHGPQTGYNVVAGNYFGVAPDGNTVVNNVHFNSGYSVSIEDSTSNNTIGPGNVMVNSWKGGIHIYGALGSGNHIFGNLIGITPNGTANSLTANRGEGIRIRFGASDVTIGPDNVITNNTRAGVLVIDNSSQFNTITQNSIYNNGEIGIDLGGNKDTGGDGVTPNDGSWGSGPNQRIDYPVITSATTTSVSGTALTGYRVEIFIADSPAGQYGEGRTFVGAGVANGSGHFTIPVSGVAAGNVLTATSTDSAGNTSEFSVNVAANSGSTNTPPTASITAPAAGSTVNGTVSIAVNANDAEDGVGSLDVDVRIDGGAWQAASWNGGTGRYQYSWNTQAASNGNYTIEARATDSDAAVATTGPINVSVNNVVDQVYSLPALIQAEDYDSYHDTTSGNSGGRYRSDDVDIETCTDPTTPTGLTCYDVGWTAAGEWLAYRVNVPTAGNYAFALRVATPSSNRTIQLQLDGVNLGAPVAIPDTDGYQNWATATAVRQLPAGQHELRLVFGSTNVNLNSIDITAAANTPPAVAIVTPANGATVNGTTTVALNASDAEDATGTLSVQVRIDSGIWQPAAWNAGTGRYQLSWDTTTASNGNHTIYARATDSSSAGAIEDAVTVNVNNVVAPTFTLPTLIQAEDYTNSHDTTSGNSGGRYRFEDVDIETCTDATTPAGQTCYSIGWTDTGEWLAYDIRVPSAGNYVFALRVSTPSSNRTIQLQLDGVNLGAPVAIPDTDGYQNWTTATAVRSLPAGDHELRLVFGSTNVNLNSVNVTASSNTAPSVGIATPASGATVSGTTTIGVTASDAQDAAGTLDVAVRIDGGVWQAASWNAGTGRYQYAWNTASLSNGSHTIEARATDSNGADATDGPRTVSVNNAPVADFVLPTLIQAEDYDSYSDTTSGNTGGRYRFNDVDIQTCTDATTPAGQTCYNVGWTDPGEWLGFDIRVPSAGTYTFAVRVATPSNNRSVQLQLDGANLGAAISVPNTGGYQTWTTVTAARQLPAGDHQLRLVVSGTNMNVNYVDVTAGGVANRAPAVAIVTPTSGATVSGATTVGLVANDTEDAAGTLDVQARIDDGAWQAAHWNDTSSRYQFSWDTSTASNGGHTIAARATDSDGATGTASPITISVSNQTLVTLPATIQAEDYVDYFDSDAGNVGGVYRNDDVDLGSCSDGSGCVYVGWTMAGEWLAYNVSTSSARDWTFRLRYASPSSGRRVKVEVDGQIISTVSLPASGGWDTWRDAAVGTTTLSAGQHTVRLLIDLDGINVNWMSVS
ncbi:MAG TPA: carbohydrate-binding protein, partial [Thermomicrobiales bacterium]|nr:carbohydrate-binding protein [Thermomicrobiales bacterium]